MPRNQQQGTTLRNRNRVTNKTRLKIIRGNIDADPLIIDEEEERARVIATSGVDAEDANEHHLQVAINAAAQRHSAFAQDSNKTAESCKVKGKRDAYIPTPDATGVVADYEVQYPPNLWTQPQTHLRFSDTVEDTLRYAINDGYSYIMDERDKEWLEKNNQGAKGEGTSTQSIAMFGATTRAARNAKSKGKEPEFVHPVYMTEDEFELVMGIFEKDTDDRYPFLHVDTSHLAPITDYEDIFSAPLPLSLFSDFLIPEFASQPNRLVALARIIYPYWRERRLELGGRRIMAQLNGDESNENDPYVCFRRRDSKPIRKTRTSQTAITDRMIRLRTELSQVYAQALHIRQREELKQEQAKAAQVVWCSRYRVSELKRKHNILSTKEEEDLLLDKERPAKKARHHDQQKWTTNQKPRQQDSPAPQTEQRLWPKDRLQKIQSDVADEVNRHRDKNSLWEDVVDLSYQPPFVSAADKLFASIPPEDLFEESYSRARTAIMRRFRFRFGRGGRLYMDRFVGRTNRPDNFALNLENLGCPSFEEFNEACDLGRRMEERWRYDEDGIIAGDAVDRSILDDFDPKYLRAILTLLTEEDRVALSGETQAFVSPSSVETNRNTPRTLFQRRIVDDNARLPHHSVIRPSPPLPTVPSSTVPSATPSTFDSPSKRALATSTIRPHANNTPPVHLMSTSSMNLVHSRPEPGDALPAQNPAVPSNGSTPRSENIGIGIRPSTSNVMVGPGHVHPMIAPASDSGTTALHAPSISRHKLQGHQFNMSTQQLPLMNGFSGNSFQMNPVNQVGGDLSAHRMMQLKLAFSNSQLLGHDQGIPQTGFPSMSPPPRPSSHLHSNLSINGHHGMENMNLNLGVPMNLRLPPNKSRTRSSPQLSNADIMTGNSTTNVSPLIPNVLSPVMRAPSANGSHLPSPHRGGPSPLSVMYGHMSPRSQVISGQSPQGISPTPLIPAAALPSPRIQQAASPLHHPATITGLSHGPPF